MKLGINTFLFTARFLQQHTGLFSNIANIGYSGVELTYADRNDFSAKKVLNELKLQNLVCSGLCPCQNDDMNLRGTKEEHDNSMKFLKECIDQAEMLETELVTGPVYSKIGVFENLSEDQLTEKYIIVAEALAELGNYAEPKGVYIALEPLIRFETDFVNTALEAKRLIDLSESSRVKIHLDTFHMNTEETDFELAFLDAGDLLFNIHASENNRGAPGSGNINWLGFKHALKHIMYDRFVNVESFHPAVPEIAFAASVRRKTSETQFTLAEESFNFLNGLFFN